MQTNVNIPSRLKRIAIALVAITLLPAVLMLLKEWSYLNENQQMIDEIYRQRLETILFSVNQYAWDVVNSWAGEVTQIQQHNIDNPSEQQLEQLLGRNRALQAIFFTDSLGAQMQFFQGLSGSENSGQRPAHFQELMKNNAQLLGKLRRYRESGYRKLQPLSADSSSGLTSLIFPIESPINAEIRFAGLVLSPREFIEIELFPKMQEVGGDRFLMACISGDEQFSFANAPSIDLDAATRKQEIWLFPDYELAIRERGETLEEMAQSWFKVNLMLVSLLVLLMVGAGWFIFRTVRQEMALAQLKSDFVSNISHELRTPLALIRMYAETLEMGRIPNEERKSEYYRIIGQESERLTHLVNNILNFSRIEAGKKAYHLQPVVLNDIVERVLESYRFHLENKGFTLETNLAKTLPEIQGDTDALSEAVINLVDNAVKYSETEHWINITTGSENGQVFVEISDRGIGIPPKEQQRIFEKFHRASDALVHNTKGSGLGLSLVQHIVRAHNGHIQLSSQPGKGSRFRLLFPAAPDDH